MTRRRWRERLGVGLLVLGTLLLVVVPGRAGSASGGESVPTTSAPAPVTADGPQLPDNGTPVVPGGSEIRRPDDPFVLAHYYIWFEPTSWNRAKSDFPALGRYSSDQESVMRTHVRWAKRAGIDGFIVSWKSTEVNDPRLEMLIQIAEDMDFKLGLTYQGLDFNREPLPADQIASDLDLFATAYSSSPSFDLFGRPLVVLTGTPDFSVDELRAITDPLDEELLILASEKKVEGYERVADAVDGNLYYWSSVDPETFPDYPGKLVDFGNAVRAHGGVWIAPVAPGFDARKVGGARVVPRRAGATLREQWNGALASIPDAIGIISWNEFSENTYIEPSENLGTEALGVVADLNGTQAPEAVDFDSSAPAETVNRDAGWARVAMLVALAIGVVLGGGFIARRRQRSAPACRPS
jgi:hypothetical protein